MALEVGSQNGELKVNKQHKSIVNLYCFLYVLSGQFLLPAVHAKPPFEPQVTHMTICSPDRPLIYPGESVTLKTWAQSSKEEALRYLWQVDTGTIKGEGAEVSWDFTGVSPGM